MVRIFNGIGPSRPDTTESTIHANYRGSKARSQDRRSPGVGQHGGRRATWFASHSIISWAIWSSIARSMTSSRARGPLGLEALSRGAARAAFVEKDRECVGLIIRNVATLRFEDRASVKLIDAYRWGPDVRAG